LHSTKSNADGAMLDVCLFSPSRDAWRRWKKKILRRSSQPEGLSPTTKVADRPGERDRWSEEP
jgi:hypothetical protein